MLARTGRTLRERFFGTEIVSGREVLAPTRQDHHPHVVVGLRAAESLVKLHQQGS